MEKKFMNIKVLFIFGIAAFMSACASTKINLVDTGAVTIERVSTKGIYVSKAYAYKDGSELIVSGKVKRSKNSSTPSGGHVDIGLFSSDGKVIKEVSTSYTPRIIKRKGAMESSFTARISIIPSEGSRIRVVYHNLSYSANSTFNCGNNAATIVKMGSSRKKYTKFSKI